MKTDNYRICSKVFSRHLHVMILWLSMAVAVVADLPAPSLDRLIAEARADVEKASRELSNLRSRIDQQRRPVQEHHRRLTDDVLEKRARLARLQEAGRLDEERRLRLEREATRLEDEVRFIHAALLEYRRGLETRIHAAERQRFEVALSRMDRALSDENRAAAGVAAETVLTEAVKLLRLRSGPHRFDGMALNAEGIGQKGCYLVIGPLVYFEHEDEGGFLVTSVAGSLLPSLFDGHRPFEHRAMAALVAGDATASVPVDIAGGAALQRALDSDRWWTQIRKGGVVMIPILITGMLSIAIGFWKFIKLRGLRRAAMASTASVREAIRRNDWEGAQTAIQKLPAPLSVLLGEVLAHRRRPHEYLEELLHERLMSMVPSWESHLGTLAVFGGVAPLLGLLGTVTGMIHTFELVTLFGTGEARLLSGGISEALVTTKFGLGIAIPVLVAHAFLVRRLRSIVGMLENEISCILNLLVSTREQNP